MARNCGLPKPSGSRLFRGRLARSVADRSERCSGIEDSSAPDVKGLEGSAREYRRRKKSTLFEVLQARVEHAFDPVELTVPGFLHLVEAAVDVIEAHVHVRSEIAQAGTIDQYPDQNRDHGRHGRERNSQDLRICHVLLS